MQRGSLPGFRQHPAPEESGSANRRLFVVFAAMALTLIVICVRLAWIQVRLPEEYIRSFNRVRVLYEPIPGRDGRILTDETVLAADIEKYDIEAHYRWIEEPADPGWLKQKTLVGLRANTGEPADVVRTGILSARDRMWQRLRSMTGVSEAQLTSRRLAVQTRVERIAESVNRRQRARAETPAPPIAEPGVKGLFETIRRQVTAPPRRSFAPIVVREELDYHLIAQDVSLGIAAEIRAHPELYPGLRVRETTQRHYPQDDFAAHVIGGRTRQPDASETHRVGRMGIERSWDGHLRGVDGKRRVTFNRRGEVIREEIVRRPVSGRDVVLTLDARLQRSAERILDAAIDPRQPSPDQSSDPLPTPVGGCIVVMDVFSGDLLTLAAAPRYDLNLMVKTEQARWDAVLADPRHPLFPRGTQMTVPPGSVFKILSAAAMLETSEADPDAHIHCQGYLDRPDRHRCLVYRHFGVGHNSINLRGALAQSCNVYFFRAARSMGPEPLIRWARRFEFGSPTGIDLPFERGGHLPTPKGSGSGRAARWYQGDTLGLAIGQSRLTVTPLQITRMMAAIANGGYLVTPRVADAANPADRSTTQLWSSRPRRRIHGLSTATIRQIQQGLFSAVQDPGGTGYKTVRLRNVSIAGKTGTAEVGAVKPDHAWFAGYVPADQPQYAIVVVLEHGGSGGRAAGPVARKLVQTMLARDLISHEPLAAR